NPRFSWKPVTAVTVVSSNSPVTSDSYQSNCLSRCWSSRTLSPESPAAISASGVGDGVGVGLGESGCVGVVLGDAVVLGSGDAATAAGVGSPVVSSFWLTANAPPPSTATAVMSTPVVTDLVRAT